MARSPRSSSKQVDALKHDEAKRRNIPTAEMESFFRREEDAAPRPPKHFPRARPLAEGETRTADEPSQPELIWNGARIGMDQCHRRLGAGVARRVCDRTADGTQKQTGPEPAR
jgi:hypothetical protein